MAMVDAHLTDGRTTFRVMSRGTLIKLFKQADLSDALDEAKAERVWVRWHPQSDWEPIKLFSAKRHSVAFTRLIERAEKQEFLDERPADELPKRDRQKVPA
jgi:hypothetical protein